MRRTLKLHPDSHCDAVRRIEVEVLRPRPHLFTFRYIVAGTAADVLTPPPSAPKRIDDLWRHTCFEVFVDEGGGYSEFNFAPSTAWAAYRFDGYRAGRRPAHEAPGIENLYAADWFELLATVKLPGRAPWRLGLAAVIEETNGRLSYWALEHPPGKPDFHHSDCFAVELA